jgi:hypothetical protein
VRPATFRPRGVRVDRSRSYGQIEALARRTRDVCRVGIFENLSSVQICPYPVTYAVAELEEGVEARTEWLRSQGKILVALSETTYENLEAGEPRARFTFSHELFHVVAHHDVVIRLSHIPHSEGLMRAVPSHKPYQDSEWQADAGAAAILMPATALADLEAHRRLDVPTVTRAFGVSYEAAKNRLDNYTNRRNDLLGLH